ncbi:hypothetical protein [Nocardiopsis alba]|uniref:hypothetical protein n=1 Tax=Nocardiopsis alba TaxID=53437 RepID=UPI0035DC2A71
MEPNVEHLGELLREYRTDSGRLQRLGGVMAAVGGAVMLGGVAVSAEMESFTDDGLYAAGMLLGVGAIILGLGVWRLVQWRRTLDRTIWVYERGLVHRQAGTITTLLWSDISRVSASEGDGLPLAEVRGAGFQCFIAERGDGGVEVDAFFEDARELAEVVYAGWRSQEPGVGENGQR